MGQFALTGKTLWGDRSLLLGIPASLSASSFRLFERSTHPTQRLGIASIPSIVPRMAPQMHPVESLSPPWLTATSTAFA